jgi:glycosidase
MNYQFTRNCLQYFAYNNISEAQFKDYTSSILMKHTQQVNEVMLNLLDSHDTARFLTLSNYNKNSLKLAAAFLFTYIGVPCIYYGTEIGMEGVGDPDCRRTMNWNEENWDKELLKYYKRLISIRKKSEALRRGSFSWINAKDGLIAFERKTDKEKVVVIINNHDKEDNFTLFNGEEEVFDAIANKPLKPDNSRLMISLDRYSAKILITKET